MHCNIWNGKDFCEIFGWNNYRIVEIGERQGNEDNFASFFAHKQKSERVNATLTRNEKGDIIIYNKVVRGENDGRDV